MASYLLEHGASKEACCSQGLQALHHACNNNREGVARLLLESGCAVDAADLAGNTAVHYAASRGVLNLVNQLVEAKCDVAAQNKAGQTVKKAPTQRIRRIKPTFASGNYIRPIQKICAFGDTSLAKSIFFPMFVCSTSSSFTSWLLRVHALGAAQSDHRRAHRDCAVDGGARA
jgi:hypothetical protein